MQDHRTELSTLGEFGLIDRIKSSFTCTQPSTSTGIGDDAAVLRQGDETWVITKDMLVENIHFDLTYVPLKHLGYKAVMANVSDIAAMNARPTQLLIGLGVSNRFSLEAIDELYAGIKAACTENKIDVIGGDTVTSPTGMTLSVTAVGQVTKNKITLRSTAQINDILCVTGDLGAAYLGLQILEREKQVFLSNPEMTPQLEKHEYLVSRQLKPHARLDIIEQLEKYQIVPTSMIDISDGLASELLHIAKASQVGVKIFEDKVPIDHHVYETALTFQISPTICALHGGEDYELLFTIKPSDYDIIKNHSDIHFIGHIHDNPSENVLISKSGNQIPLSAQGWKHFK